MGGGKKKRTLKQIERTRKRKDEKKTEKKPKRTVSPTATEKRSIPGITAPDLNDSKFLEGLKKMKVITPFSIAQRYEMRLSMARRILRELERKGKLKFVSKSRSLRIYAPTD